MPEKYCAREGRFFPAGEFKFDEEAGGEVHDTKVRHFRETGSILTDPGKITPADAFETFVSKEVTEDD